MLYIDMSHEDDHIFHIYYDSVLMAPFDKHVITSSVVVGDIW